MLIDFKRIQKKHSEIISQILKEKRIDKKWAEK